MPAKMFMRIGNNNPTPPQVNNAIKALNQQNKFVPSNLNAPMINRVQGVKSGCGSCGRG